MWKTQYTFIWTCLLFVTLISRTCVNAYKSRAFQHFGLNCQLNFHAENELEMGMRYLNASIYMRHDRVALHGFGKLFKKLYNEQIDNIEKIKNYISLRGGVFETPGLKRSFFNNLDSRNYFENESVLIGKFLEEEKKLNLGVLKMYRTVLDNKFEKNCISRNNRYEKNLSDTVDVYSLHYLDSHFLEQKVKRIKYLADLIRKIHRFDQHIHNIDGSVTRHMNTLGIHILDQELQEENS